MRALLPGRTNPRNCLEITLLFNGCDPAFLQSYYDRPWSASLRATSACRLPLFHVQPYSLAAVDKLARDHDRGENGHHRPTFQANHGEGRARNSRI